MKTKQLYIFISLVLNAAMFCLINFGNAFWSKVGLYMVFVNFTYHVGIIRYYENQQK
jgi:hypothetical protein